MEAVKKYEGDVIGDIYDKLFDNYTDVDFVNDFSDAEVDYINARIYLGNFILKIERVENV